MYKLTTVYGKKQASMKYEVLTAVKIYVFSWVWRRVVSFRGNVSPPWRCIPWLTLNKIAWRINPQDRDPQTSVSFISTNLSFFSSFIFLALLLFFLRFSLCIYLSLFLYYSQFFVILLLIFFFLIHVSLCVTSLYLFIRLLFSPPFCSSVSFALS